MPILARLAKFFGFVFQVDNIVKTIKWVFLAAFFVILSASVIALIALLIAFLVRTYNYLSDLINMLNGYFSSGCIGIFLTDFGIVHVLMINLPIVYSVIVAFLLIQLARFLHFAYKTILHFVAAI